MTSRGRGHAAVVMAGALVMGSLTACGPGGDTGRSGDPETLRWYVDDAGSYAAVARSCSDDSGGAYRIELVEAPASPAERRTDLLQRLRTGDDLDLLGVDTALVAELTDLDLLAEVPRTVAAELVDGRTEESVAAVTVDGTVVAAPFWYEPQVLFHRGSAGERAGLDMTTAVTWDALIAGASRVGSSVQVADTTAGWVRALVGTADDLVAALEGAAGAAAATVVQAYGATGVGPGPSAEAAAAFAAPGGTFLVGPASLARSDALAPVLGELSIAPYPLTTPRDTGGPLSGTALAVVSGTGDVGFDAVSCLTAAPAQESVFTSTGHLPTLTEVLVSIDVTEALVDPEVVGEALATGLPEPVSPVLDLLDRALESTWTPLGAVDASTPAQSAAEARRLFDGGLS